jgi:hypothetical protein
MGAFYEVLPSDISVQSGAMALLCANADTDHIRLLGCWQFNEMLRSLHVQVFPVDPRFAPVMLQFGHFSLIPNQPVPALPLLAGLASPILPIQRISIALT